MHPECANWNEMEWEEVRPGIARKVFTGEGSTMSLNKVEFGHAVSPHTHMHEQLVYILEGECNFTVDGKTHSLKPGGVLHVPGNVEHYIEVTSKAPVLNLDIFTPKRADYVKN